MSWFMGLAWATGVLVGAVLALLFVAKATKNAIGRWSGWR
jgi:hypothetical protein